MTKTEISANCDGVAGTDEVSSISASPPLWGSARLTYTICAFFAMVFQLCLRNTLNFVVLCMVKRQQVNNFTNFSVIGVNDTCGPINRDSEISIEGSGDLLWTRSQEFALLGSFYYGYLITSPIAGRLADRFGGKTIFVHSLTTQSLVFMLIPYFARKSYTGAVITRLIQGLIAGCGNPAIYQLFSTWAHTTERTASMSFAYGGFSVGTLLAFPISSLLCKYGWELVFYAIGSVSLIYGICCHWLIYSRLEDHPRLSKEEYDYLKACDVKKSTTGVIPWKSILSSVPIYAFVFTHIFHNYGIIVFSLLTPRFFKEAMHFPLDKVGFLSAAPFLGSFGSKAITITISSIVEKRPNLNMTKYRCVVYTVCNCGTIILNLGIILCTCHQRFIVVLLTVCIGITTDVGFSCGYWPSLLYVAPSFVGLITGIANCLGTVSGFLAPLGISAIVRLGTKEEWNLVMGSLIGSYFLGAVVFGVLGSSKLESWDQEVTDENRNDCSAEIVDTPL